MPFSFVLAIIVASIGIVLVVLIAVGYKKESKSDPSKSSLILGVSVVFGVIVGVLVFSASATKLSTRQVGVPVTLGKPADHVLKEGFHLVAPWTKVEKFDTFAQFLTRNGDDAITVRLGNQTTAKVDIRQGSQWNIDPNGDVLSLYRQYKSFDRIQDTVINGAAQAALTEAFQDFDPLASIAEGADKASSASVDAVSAEALTAMRASLGSGIKVSTLRIFVNYDSVTQTKLNDYAVSLAGTRIAQQNTKTATEIATANTRLAGQKATSDSGVQYQNCLSLLRDLASKNQLGSLPQAFQCSMPGTQGNSPSIIVPSK